jgi:hypothetical protein
MTAWNTPFSSGAVWARSMFAGNCLCFVLSAILLWTLVSPRAAAQVAAEPLQTPPAFSSPSPAEAEDVMAGLNTPEGTLGYALGLRIGARITADFKAQHAPINPAALARGLADAIVGRKPLLGEQQLSQALEAFEKKMQEQELALGRRMAEVAKVNKIKAAAFLEAHSHSLQTPSRRTTAAHMWMEPNLMAPIPRASQPSFHCGVWCRAGRRRL